MNKVLEGVLCACSREEMRQIYEGLPAPADLLVGNIADSLWIIFRDTTEFSAELEQVAATLSNTLEKTLLVCWNERQNQRTASLFENGQLSRRFDQSDEIWVVLDDTAASRSENNQTQLIATSPHGEVDTIHNALQMGLELFGHRNWQELYAFINQTRSVKL